MELRYPAQVGVHEESFILKPQHNSVKHGHDEQRAVREPSKAARLARDLDLRLDSSSEVHRLDGMVVEVGEPEPPLVPTWRLPESQPFGSASFDGVDDPFATGQNCVADQLMQPGRTRGSHQIILRKRIA
jgi:hypothetical protein